MDINSGRHDGAEEQEARERERERGTTRPKQHSEEKGGRKRGRYGTVRYGQIRAGTEIRYCTAGVTGYSLPSTAPIGPAASICTVSVDLYKLHSSTRDAQKGDAYFYEKGTNNVILTLKGNMCLQRLYPRKPSSPHQRRVAV
jgi:hypothetical protein